MNFVKRSNPCGKSWERIKRSAILSLEETADSARKSSQLYVPHRLPFNLLQYEKELALLIELKRENMHIFVDAARATLQNLWDELYFSEDQMAEFTPAFTGTLSLVKPGAN